MKKRILIIEDEDSLRKALTFSLELEGYTISEFASGKMALQTADFNAFDLIILDVMLPEINGWDVCNSIRKVSQTPIIFLSAKGESTDRIKGLKLGGNDYLSKPFDTEELLLRIEKQLPQDNSLELNSKNLSTALIDFNAYTIDGVNGLVQMPQKEMEVLKLLVLNDNVAVPKSEIQQRVWSEKTFPGGRTLDNYISNLRKQIEINPKKPKFLHTVRGVGYKFTSDVK